MNEEKRPGGLTALAVINFVFFGLGVLSILGMIALFALMGKIPTEDMNEQQRVQFEAFQNMGGGVVAILIGLSLVSNVLLILSGIGYLKQKRIMGRMLGNGYAVLNIASTIFSAVKFAPEVGGGFNIMSMVGLIYPVVTLILINLTFKDDLTN